MEMVLIKILTHKKTPQNAVFFIVLISLKQVAHKLYNTYFNATYIGAYVLIKRADKYGVFYCTNNCHK